MRVLLLLPVKALSNCFFFFCDTAVHALLSTLVCCQHAAFVSANMPLLLSHAPCHRFFAFLGLTVFHMHVQSP